MELTDASISASVQYLGNEVIDVPAGKHFMIGTSPPNDLDLDVVVPEGKAWAVRVHVEIIETDV